MSTPDDTLFEEAFADFAHAAELMVDPVDSAVIHGRVRRRRTTKGAMAAALAALVVAVPAAWWLQESNGQEVDPPPADDTTAVTTEAETSPEEAGGGTNSVPDGQATGGDDLVLPTFTDLVGAEIELPEFFPGAGELNDACPVAPATITDAAGSAYGDGKIRLLKVVQTTLEEDGPVEAVALFGCTPGDALVTQAVSVAGDGEGGWEATEAVALGDTNEFPLLDIAPAAVTGVLLLVPEPHGTDQSGPLDYDIYRYRTGADLEDVTDTAYLWGITDLAVEVEKRDNGDGTWTAEATVTNAGDHESQAFTLSLCADPALAVDGLDGLPACTEAREPTAEYEALAPGETVRAEWTVTPAPFDEWSGDAQAGGAYFDVSVDMRAYGSDAFAFDYDNSNDYGAMALIADDVAETP
ncbi:hypothetical protein SAMN05216298_3819 [Glycomyces sambucus]|uniref:Uncharacterized protein n=1 Tax=Glycomyces sambucus TaxID=380244 RepID=A0A1G9JS42_9ACTN|nr:hypothetical protein [Glycomyces sambucus]SDL40035.1 hypothetical protein SAMN05216298_3819 [Glycomyces sambucus]